jgi:chemotaxis protein histidine kinase CheA
MDLYCKYDDQIRAEDEAFLDSIFDTTTLNTYYSHRISSDMPDDLASMYDYDEPNDEEREKAIFGEFEMLEEKQIESGDGDSTEEEILEVHTILRPTKPTRQSTIDRYISPTNRTKELILKNQTFFLSNPWTKKIPISKTKKQKEEKQKKEPKPPKEKKMTKRTEKRNQKEEEEVFPVSEEKKVSRKRKQPEESSSIESNLVVKQIESLKQQVASFSELLKSREQALKEKVGRSQKKQKIEEESEEEEEVPKKKKKTVVSSAKKSRSRYVQQEEEEEEESEEEESPKRKRKSRKQPKEPKEPKEPMPHVVRHDFSAYNLEDEVKPLLIQRACSKCGGVDASSDSVVVVSEGEKKKKGIYKQRFHRITHMTDKGCRSSNLISVSGYCTACKLNGHPEPAKFSMFQSVKNFPLVKLLEGMETKTKEQLEMEEIERKKAQLAEEEKVQKLSVSPFDSQEKQ